MPSSIEQQFHDGADTIVVEVPCKLREVINTYDWSNQNARREFSADVVPLPERLQDRFEYTVRVHVVRQPELENDHIEHVYGDPYLQWKGDTPKGKCSSYKVQPIGNVNRGPYTSVDDIKHAVTQIVQTAERSTLEYVNDLEVAQYVEANADDVGEEEWTTT